ncbi:MAG: DMT family transporter [Gammaproteobacteria bacterium]|nr:DMT family transporter [Gammaproteobacteria bacterium]
MSKHSLQVSGSWQLGLTYSLITMLSWASLPLALEISLQYTDAWSLTWFRMLLAAVMLLTWRLFSSTKPINTLRQQSNGNRILLILAALLLTGNYVFFLLGLRDTSPANSQVLIQVAPVLMAIGGMVFFRERYNRWQWLGFITLLFGLAVFFREQLLSIGHSGHYLRGIGFMLIAAISWAAYALLQKRLMGQLRAMQIMLFIYICSALVLLPTVDFASFVGLSVSAWLWLAFCGLNTLVAYGAFGEAMQHWEASRVSAIISVTPLGTIAVLSLATLFVPGLIEPETLNAVSITAAVVVVCGSMLTSLTGKRRRAAIGQPASIESPLHENASTEADRQQH